MVALTCAASVQAVLIFQTSCFVIFMPINVECQVTMGAGLVFLWRGVSGFSEVKS